MYGGLVLKFFDGQYPERGKQLLDGRFYCAPLTDFRRGEAKEEASFINDPMEGYVIAKNPNYRTLKGEVGDKQFQRITHTFLENVGICCFVHLDLNRDFVHAGRGQAVIDPTVIEQLRYSFSDEPAVMWFEEEFSEMMEGIQIIDKDDICFANYALVNYLEGIDGSYAHMGTSPKETLDYFLTKAVFQKQARFSFQREFRLAALSTNIRTSSRTLVSQKPARGQIFPNLETLRGITLDEVF